MGLKQVEVDADQPYVKAINVRTCLEA